MFSMEHEVILRKAFSEGVGYLISGVGGEYFN